MAAKDQVGPENMDNRPQGFREKVCETYAFLKSAHTAESVAVRRLPLTGYEADLVPVGEYHAKDQCLIADLAAWRLINNWAYPTQFQPTFNSTASWLRTQVLDVEDRIMFLVCDRPTGTVVGHIGFGQALDEGKSVKLDNCMRGIKTGYPGIMSSAMRTLMLWAEDCLGAQEIRVPVFQDNAHMLTFLERFGFHRAELLGLRRHDESGRVCYLPIADDDPAPPDKFHQRMICRLRQARPAA
jgi:RimJ/RimL family protein N-acetyltransferase